MNREQKIAWVHKNCRFAQGLLDTLKNWMSGKPSPEEARKQAEQSFFETYGHWPTAQELDQYMASRESMPAPAAKPSALERHQRGQEQTLQEQEQRERTERERRMRSQEEVMRAPVRDMTKPESDPTKWTTRRKDMGRGTRM